MIKIFIFCIKAIERKQFCYFFYFPCDYDLLNTKTAIFGILKNGVKFWKKLFFVKQFLTQIFHFLKKKKKKNESKKALKSTLGNIY